MKTQIAKSKLKKKISLPKYTNIIRDIKNRMPTNWINKIKWTNLRKTQAIKTGSRRHKNINTPTSKDIELVILNLL